MTSIAALDSDLPLTPDHLADMFDTEFQFRDTPGPVPADVRAEWRIPLLMLIVNTCRNTTASLQQVQAIAWAAIFEESREGFLKALEGSSDPASLLIRYDPAVTRAANLAVGLDLLFWRNRTRLAMTEKGKDLVGGILSCSNVLVEERLFLSEIKGITMKTLNRMLG